MSSMILFVNGNEFIYSVFERRFRWMRTEEWTILIHDYFSMVCCSNELKESRATDCQVLIGNPLKLSDCLSVLSSAFLLKVWGHIFKLNLRSSGEYSEIKSSLQWKIKLLEYGLYFEWRYAYTGLFVFNIIWASNTFICHALISLCSLSSNFSPRPLSWWSVCSAAFKYPKLWILISTLMGIHARKLMNSSIFFRARQLMSNRAICAKYCQWMMYSERREMSEQKHMDGAFV